MEEVEKMIERAYPDASNFKVECSDVRQAPDAIVLWETAHQHQMVLENYLKEESWDKREEPLDTTIFTKENLVNIPRQTDESDCGKQICLYVCGVYLKKTRNFVSTAKYATVPKANYLTNTTCYELSRFF